MHGRHREQPQSRASFDASAFIGVLRLRKGYLVQSQSWWDVMMPFESTFRVVTLTVGLTSLAFIALGLYALIRGRPFVMHARWMLALAVLPMSPSVFMLSPMFFSGGRSASAGLTIILLIAVLTVAIVICFLALTMRGYIVWGTTQDSFRDALMSALSSLNLESEETLSSIRLPSVPAELQVAVHGWIGTGQLHLRHGGPPGLLSDIAGGMNVYFSSANVKTNMTWAVFYLILGVLMSGMVVAFIAIVSPAFHAIGQ